jgi:hypothetical protein
MLSREAHVERWCSRRTDASAPRGAPTLKSICNAMPLCAPQQYCRVMMLFDYVESLFFPKLGQMTTHVNFCHDILVLLRPTCRLISMGTKHIAFLSLSLLLTYSEFISFQNQI